MGKSIKYWFKDSKNEGQISRLFVYKIEKINGETIYKGKCGKRTICLKESEYGSIFSKRKEDLENSYEFLRFEKDINGNISVYTRKTEKELMAGTIMLVKGVIGENKFFPNECIYFGKNCLRELSLFLKRLDEETEVKENGK